MKYDVEIKGEHHSVEIKSFKDGSLVALVNGRELNCEIVQPEPNTYLLITNTPERSVYEIRTENQSEGETNLRIMGALVSARVIDPKHRSRTSDHGASGRQQIVSPMPGKVVRLMVSVGDEVKLGQGVIVIEAMKMQNELKSPKDGHVIDVAVSDGQTVTASQVLITIE